MQECHEPVSGLREVLSTRSVVDADENCYFERFVIAGCRS